MFSLVGLAEPRIKSEIIFKFAVAPTPGMNETALLACIDWVGHGFEIVQSIFPEWKFSAADTVAAFGLHGALLIGARHSIAAHAEHWSRALSSFEIDLKRAIAHDCTRGLPLPGNYSPSPMRLSGRGPAATLPPPSGNSPGCPLRGCLKSLKPMRDG
jgi:hypothetical protein